MHCRCSGYSHPPLPVFCVRSSRAFWWCIRKIYGKKTKPQQTKTPFSWSSRGAACTGRAAPATTSRLASSTRMHIGPWSYCKQRHFSRLMEAPRNGSAGSTLARGLAACRPAHQATREVDLTTMRHASIDSNYTVPQSRRFRFAWVGPALLCSMSAPSVHAQEMEPRAYSAVPVGTNFAVFDYARSSGNVSFDLSLPITNVQAHINIFSLGYSHSFGVAGHTVSVAVSMPYANANVNGDVKGIDQQQYRSGLGDVHFRIAANLLGDPALSLEEFMRRAPSTIFGFSLSVVAPTGQYVPTPLINIGANRWSFKPEIGLSQPFGNWFMDSAACVCLFTDNADFSLRHP